MTDIRMAIDAGMASALVLTGETTRAMLAGIPAEDQPTWILDRIDHVLPSDPGAHMFTPVGNDDRAL
jgi:ribonucleotide monophosphatase NagD (HAD superfamily)